MSFDKKVRLFFIAAEYARTHHILLLVLKNLLCYGLAVGVAKKNETLYNALNCLADLRKKSCHASDNLLTKSGFKQAGFCYFYV